ncbi:AAA family ATPase [Elizabethkingia anophelis]|uniref:AAA family ATPase n=1 Tax=Elizabethkingia anophelis TaxID=1117645 RepID=UPI002011DD69|nr:DUF3696 domain-containing protein [Elizabethkingia anophelis]EJC8060250.1 DUF3696 domain-containing protein [Elizabethkingia anophelis]MCL1643069.1 DUF3696 domain-containing protein [Elizabethkingia anophelis]MCL1643750.1 DUF3696 domain-containing protein [Elizabethkingia anophelis]MCT4032849.1 DUF3696 domain-containing protein [Elizabethkingia anophelis]MDV3781447.1 hypothetical protein [Elizabethkingia anophelis]
MITNIKIQNFKSLKYVDCEMRNLNILMGLNGMGKSSFIQTILLLMQSDKLEENVLDLNGPLAQIGQGKDALYQFAENENIYINLTLANEISFNWIFEYQKDKEKLFAKKTDSENNIIFFKKETVKFQYIPAERIGPQDIYDASTIIVSDKKQIGLLGEFAAYFINVFGQEYRVDEKLRHPKASSPNLLSQINAWMKEISPGVSLNTKYVPEVNKVILDYQFDLLNDTTNLFRPKNVGFGISYVLPIVLALLTAENNKTIIIENPESHIHPRGQAELGKLISLAANTGAQLLIETHSDHILNGIRVAVKEKLVNRHDVNIMYFEKSTTDKEQFTSISRIQLDEGGELNHYPENMLDEWSNQLLKLL